MAGFREFLARGNVLDLAVAVIIGAAFGAIVTSLTGDIIMPAVGAIFGEMDFSSYFIRLGPIPAGYAGDPNNYAALKAAGVPMLGYGQFLTALVNFQLVDDESGLTDEEGGGSPSGWSERGILAAPRDPRPLEEPRVGSPSRRAVVQSLSRTVTRSA